MAHSDSPRKFVSEKPVSDPHGNGGGQQEGTRVIKHHLTSDGRHALYLTEGDEHHGHNHIYLGTSEVFERGTSPSSYNIAVPVFPRCYYTPARDPREAQNPPQGWLYIIRRRASTQGPMLVELWRELESSGNGFFRDVHLTHEKGKDFRDATGAWMQRIIVPYRIDNEAHEIWMAFSEVQWSWARVQQMKKDPALREKRMHKLNLSDCLNAFAGSQYTPPQEQKQGQNADPGTLRIGNATGEAKLYNICSAPDMQAELADCMREDIPAVYLDNPVGIAKSLGLVYRQRCEEMLNRVEALRAVPAQDTAYAPGRWVRAAEVLNQYLHAKPGTLPDDATEEQRKAFAAGQKKREEYRGKVDQAALDEALGKQKREELREKLQQAKKWLVDFLRHELAYQKDDSALLHALDDYFTLPASVGESQSIPVKNPVTGEIKHVWPSTYPKAWACLADILRYLDKHAYAFDIDLAPEQSGWALRRKDEGVQLLTNMADPQFGMDIHSRLFPKTAAGDNPVSVDKAEVKEDDPVFKTTNFDSLSSDEMARALEAVSPFLEAFGEVIAMDDRGDAAFKEEIERSRHSLVRLASGVLGTDMEQVTYSADDLVAFKQSGGDNAFGLKKPLLLLGKAAQLSFTKANAAMEGKAVPVALDTLVDSGGPGVTGFKSAPGSDYRVENAKVQSAPGTMATSDPKVNVHGDDVPLKLNTSGSKRPKTGSRTYRLTGYMVLQDEARQRLFDRIGSNKQNLAVLAQVMGAVDVMNFVKALQALGNNRNDDERGVMIAGAIKGFCDTATALAKMREAMEVAEKANPLANAGRALSHQVQGETIAQSSKAARSLEALGRFGNIIGMGLTLRSLTENLEQNDDAWIADAFTFSSAAISALGSTAVGADLLALVGISTAWVPVISITLLVVGYLASLAWPDDTSFETWLENGPFTKDKADRFGGHAPGSDIAKHTYALDPKLEAMAPSEQGQKRNKYRYAMWCEKPDEAYLSLLDALYRPQIVTKEVMLNQMSQIQLHIHTPFLLPQSKLFIMFSRKEEGWRTAGQAYKGESESWSIATGEEIANRRQPDTGMQIPTVEELQTGSNQFTIERLNHHETTCDLQVRLDLHGDQEYCLPFEPAFKGNDISTDAKGNKWVGLKQLFQKPRLSRDGRKDLYDNTSYRYGNAPPPNI